MNAILTLMTLMAAASPADFKHKTLPEIAVENCSHVKPERYNEALKIALILFEEEEKLKIPAVMRGMSLAAACRESGFNPGAKGDRKFSRNKKKPMALGVLQLWPIYERMYPGLVRTDPRSAARGWLSHIIKMLPKIRRQCKYRSVKKVWIAAWVTGIRYKKPGGRCKEVPLHLRYFRKIRKVYENQGSTLSR